MTEFVNKVSLAVLTGEEFRVRFDGLLLPEKPETYQIDGTIADGWAVLEEDSKPALDFGEHVEPGEIRKEGDRVIRGWTVVRPTETEFSAIIEARRYTAEVGGTTVSGIPIATDDRSKSLITGAALRATRSADYTLRWKTADGFVDLNADQVIAVADAVSDHVQACFDRESALLDAVADGSITAEMLEEGWPA